MDWLNKIEDEINPSARRRTVRKKNSSLSNSGTSLLPRDPNHKPVNLDELEKEAIKAQLRRNNSDSIRSKDELKPKRMILREL